jgi:hypothetical protein
MPEPSQPSGDDPMEEELTLSQVAKEFRLNRSTLNVWVWAGKIPSRLDHTELGVPYYWVKRGEVSKFLANRPKRGRPLNS